MLIELSTLKLVLYLCLQDKECIKLNIPHFL